MQKIPTLFERDPEDRSRVLPIYAVDLPANALATAQFDGTCVAYDGTWWARREVKPNKSAPPGFRPISTDPLTGKTIGWVPIEDDPQWPHDRTAIANSLDRLDLPLPLAPFAPLTSTFEAIGPHFQGNPHVWPIDALVPHGQVHLYDAPTDFDGLRDYLATCPFEGIVWWDEVGPVAKIKRRDFGLPWPRRKD